MLEIGQFTSEAETCPYLPDRNARSHYRLVLNIDPAEYSELLASGWRRFGRVIFRPRCDACAECVPIRVVVDSFSPSKTQRRVWRRNQDVEVELGEPTVDDERLDLYQRHHREREAARGWRVGSMSSDDYSESFVHNAVRTREFRFRLEGRLVGIAYVGEAEDALNSIYGFADPALLARSLGIFDVLTEIEVARQLGKRYLYLGFFVSGCSSMEYKSSFRAHELFRDGSWGLVDGSSGLSSDDASTGGDRPASSDSF